jgi:hypothetical protein
VVVDILDQLWEDILEFFACDRHCNGNTKRAQGLAQGLGDQSVEYDKPFELLRESAVMRRAVAAIRGTDIGQEERTNEYIPAVRSDFSVVLVKPSRVYCILAGAVTAVAGPSEWFRGVSALGRAWSMVMEVGLK